MRGGGAAARCAGAGCGSGRRDRPRSPWGTVEGCRGLGAAAAGRAPRRIRTQGRPCMMPDPTHGTPAARLPRRADRVRPRLLGGARRRGGRERKVAGSPGGGSGRPPRRLRMRYRGSLTGRRLRVDRDGRRAVPACPEARRAAQGGRLDAGTAGRIQHAQGRREGTARARRGAQGRTGRRGAAQKRGLHPLIVLRAPGTQRLSRAAGGPAAAREPCRLP